MAALYARNATLQDAWEHESDTVLSILQALEDALRDRYELDEPLGVGGSGVVVQVYDLSLGTKRALKFSRPSPGKEQLLSQFLLAETERLIELAHQNLMPIFARGAVTCDSTTYPYYVMQLFDDIEDADDWVTRDNISEAEVLHLLERSLDAVSYMHSKGIVHLDLKPANILVRSNGDPVIADLGFAKVLRSDSGMTLIGGTEGFIHPEARALLDDLSSDPNRLRGEAERQLVREKGPLWDVFSMGKTILALLSRLTKRNDRCLDIYTQRYLKLMACRMLDGRNTSDERVLGLSTSALEELKHTSAKTALRDVQKLTGGYDLEAHVPELKTHVLDTIQVSTFSTTPFTPRVKALVEHPFMLRLGGFTQLSMLNLIYPTATHTRLEHVIGTYSAVARYITALYHDPLNPLFKQLLTEEDAKAALLAALLHDIGHYALAHDLEEASQRVFSHEMRGRTILTNEVSGLQRVVEDRTLSGTEVDGWSIPMSRVVSILDADPHAMKGTLKDRVLHSLIDGPLDADKLDYLIRDSINLGLPYGNVIDVERLLRCLTIVTKEMGDATYASLGIHEKGRVTAEAVTFARYALYGSVYWHHAYRSVKAMLKRMAWEYMFRVAESDAARREGVAKRIRGQLYEALDTAGSAAQRLPLFGLTGGAQIHPGDREVLRWLAGRSGRVGEQMADLIEQRHLFKRVLVLSEWGNKTLWSDLSQFLGSAEDWQKKLAFQRDFQARIVEQVEQRPESDAPTSLVVADARNAFLAAAERDDVLLLVDCPPERAGSKGSLEFVQEEDRRRAKVEELPLDTLERSPVWESLRQALSSSLSKVRVYCHPDHSRFLSAHLSRSDIEVGLDRALRGHQ